MCHITFIIKRLLNIEFSVFRKKKKGGWRCRKGLKRGYCMFWSRQGIPSRDRVQEMPRQATAGFGSRQGIPGRGKVFFWICVTTRISVS